jgi:hypothetical protein
MLLHVPLHIRRELWLQQDGVPLHFGRNVTAFLNHHFQNHWIGRQCPITWPPRSPNLAPLDYNLWLCMKSLMYAVKSSTRAEILNRTVDVSANIKMTNPLL